MGKHTASVNEAFSMPASVEITQYNSDTHNAYEYTYTNSTLMSIFED